MSDVYAITVRETLEKTVCVRAESLYDALSKIENAYRNVEVIIEPECITDTEFIPSFYAGENGIVPNDEISYYANNYELIMDDKELWNLAQLIGKQNYEEDDNGDWEEADKYAREDYVHSAYMRLKGE